MPQMTITITLDLPEGSTVGIEGTETATGGSGPDGRQKRQGGRKGRLDGSASEKQRKLIYARAREADRDLDELLATVGAESLDEIGWRDVQDLVAELDGSPQTADDDEIPF